jgi:GNAT superfamily N-acetyltransferase
MPKTLPSDVTVRPAVARDEPRWRELFDAYCVFYERSPSEPLARHTWTRILDDTSPIHAIVAEDPNHGVIGIANYVLHEHTLGLTPACYLGDLFVDPPRRGAGVGEQLIRWLVEEMKREGWSRLYWHTRANNARARGLYEKFTPHSDFVRYTVYAEINPGRSRNSL